MKDKIFFLVLGFIFIFGGCDKNRENNGNHQESIIEENIQNDNAIIIDEKSFPDINFRQYVQIKFDKNKDGYLSENEITDIKEIFIDRRTFNNAEKIESIEGIELFTDLEDCRIWDTRIHSIDFSSNNKLKILIIYDEVLNRINLSNNYELEQLTLVTNIKEIDVSRLSKLKKLDISGTSVNVIDLSENLELEWLDISRTDVKEINISNNKLLYWLAIGETKIESIDIRSNVNLQYLNCECTAISSINIINNTELLSIYCFGSNIEEIDLENCPKVTEIICNEDTAINGVEQLKYLTRYNKEMDYFYESKE